MFCITPGASSFYGMRDLLFLLICAGDIISYFLSTRVSLLKTEPHDILQRCVTYILGKMYTSRLC